MNSSDQGAVERILDRAEARADCEDQLSVGDLIDAFGRKAHGPAIFVAGLVAVSPLGAIPGASIFLATVTVLLAAQYALRDGAPALPGWIARRRVDGDRVARVLEAMRPWAERVSRLLRPRARYLTEPPWSRVAALAMVLLALSMYPLALVPWGVTAPGLGLVAMGLAIAAGDGAVLMGGAVLALGSVAWLMSALV